MKLKRDCRKAVLCFETDLGFSPREWSSEEFHISYRDQYYVDQCDWPLQNVVVSHVVINGRSFFEIKCAQNAKNCNTVPRCLLRWFFSVQLHGVQKLRGFSPPANYTDRATVACRRNLLKSEIKISLLYENTDIFRNNNFFSASVFLTL
jgi:hypothetical protein